MPVPNTPPPKRRLSMSFPLGLVLLLILVSVLLSTQTNVSHAGDNIWTWAGIGGTPLQLLVDPQDSDTVYARTYDGILKSTNGGNSWENVTPTPGEDASWIVMAQDDPDVLYATSNSGTYRTNNGGASWKPVHTKCCVYAVSPADWKEAYLAEVVSPGVGITTSKLHKTIDGGQTWTALSGWEESYGRIQDIAIAPSAPNILIATTERPSNGIMYKSIDAGQSWSTIGGSYITEIFSVTFDPKNSNTLFLATNSPGGWKSTNGGISWQPLANGLQPRVWRFAAGRDNTQVIHAANSAGGVRETTDGGASWVPINQGIAGLSVRSIAVGSGTPLKIYAGLEDAGVWKLTRTTIQDFGITINNGALYTNETDVTLTFSAPPGTTQMIISNDGGFGGVSWESFATSKPWEITSYGSYVIPRTVYAKFKTNGQISGQYQDDIILDQTPPEGSVQIEGTFINSATGSLPAAYMDVVAKDYIYLPFISNRYTQGMRPVILALSATDDVSGVDSMLVSNNASFAQAKWQAYATSMDWLVPDNKDTIVYVKFRDRAGNTSKRYSAVAPAP